MNPNDLPYGETLVFEQTFKANTYSDNTIAFRQYAYKTKPHKRTIIINNNNYIKSLLKEGCSQEEICHIIKTEQRYIDVPELIFLININEYAKKLFLCKNMFQLTKLKIFISENNKLYCGQFLNLYHSGLACTGINYPTSTLTPKDIINNFWNSTFDFSIRDHKEWKKGNNEYLKNHIFIKETNEPK